MEEKKIYPIDEAMEIFEQLLKANEDVLYRLKNEGPEFYESLTRKPLDKTHPM